jgi:hypothetical protein
VSFRTNINIQPHQCLPLPLFSLIYIYIYFFFPPRDLSLVCLVRDDNFEKQGLIDFNFNIFRSAILEVFEIRKKSLQHGSSATHGGAGGSNALNGGSGVSAGMNAANGGGVGSGKGTVSSKSGRW